MCIYSIIQQCRNLPKKCVSTRIKHHMHKPNIHGGINYEGKILGKSEMPSQRRPVECIMPPRCGVLYSYAKEKRKL